jgi:hypothetical protein
MELFVQVNRKNRGGPVVCNPLEDLGKIRDPKGRLESRANFVQAL